jgi:membrane-associated phospholipid phosphatase
VDAASLAGAYAVTYSLKYIVNRDRPYDTYDYIQNLGTDKDPSFPSGHTTNAFATATSLTLAFKKWYVAAPSFAWAGLVGYSRMHMGMHYPSDVLAGAVIGSGSAVICYYGKKIIEHQYAKRKSQPQEP